MWKPLSSLCLAFCLCLRLSFAVFCQDAPQGLLMEALKLSENSGDNLTALEQSMTGYRKITGDLLSRVSSMQDTIKQQQQQSQQDWANYLQSEERWKNKSESSEKIINDLSQSYSSLLDENQTLKAAMSEEQARRRRSDRVMLVEGSVLLLIVVGVMGKKLWPLLKAALKMA
jgi:hypothetical protein